MFSQQAAGVDHRRMAGEPNGDAFLDADVAPPNRRAQYRGYRMIQVLVLLAGIAALVLGIAESVQTIASAFPTPAALLQGAAWMHFFAGVGQLTIIGAFVIVVALVWRWRLRRAARRAGAT